MSPADALERLQDHLARSGRERELQLVRQFARDGIADVGAVRRGLFQRRFYMDYPRFAGVPAEVYRAEGDMGLVARVLDVRHRGGRIEVTGFAYVKHLSSSRSRMRAWLKSGQRRIDLPLRRQRRPEATADSRQSAVSHDDSGFVLAIDPGVLRQRTWTLYVEVTVKGVRRVGRVKAYHWMGERRLPAPGGRQLTVAAPRGLVIAPADSEPPRTGLVVDHVRWQGALVLSGYDALRGMRGPREGCARELVLRDGDLTHAWPIEWRRDRFSVAVGTTMEGLPPRSGIWEVLAGGEPVVFCDTLLADLPPGDATDLHERAFQTGPAGEVRLAIRPALSPRERGRYATRRRRGEGRIRTRLRDAVLFDSYGGSQYSCNPRAISEELAARGGLEIVWATRDGQFRVPAGVRQVLYGSRAHEEALATSRYVVANRRTQPGWYRKRRGQMFVQTWHGTPLKRLGHDTSGLPSLYEDLERFAGMWDLMISPNPFSTPILRRAFGYEGEMLESGYPRNDALFRPSTTRARLAIPEHSRVILYAPTWRDDEYEATGPVDLALDLPLAASRLGRDDVLLVRAHYLIADRVRWPATDPRIVDVSRFPDMADLLAVTDVLVTDYSSAMFDFACTGRPMIFFAYDLERYRDHVRGFYVDFERQAPGPIVRTTGDLMDALDEPPRPYAEFAARFCAWDDGNASARVADRMLGSSNGPGIG